MRPGEIIRGLISILVWFQSNLYVEFHLLDLKIFDVCLANMAALPTSTFPWITTRGSLADLPMYNILFASFILHSFLAFYAGCMFCSSIVLAH